jgi:hypothetical protein
VNVNFFMAARGRILYQGRTTLSGAMLDKPDDDRVIQALESAFALMYGNQVNAPLDAIEYVIAQQVDAGEELPISNEEGYQAARWLAQGTVESLPSPIPRAFTMYLAKAFTEAGKYETFEAALESLLSRGEA